MLFENNNRKFREITLNYVQHKLIPVLLWLESIRAPNHAGWPLEQKDLWIWVKYLMKMNLEDLHTIEHGGSFTTQILTLSIQHWMSSVPLLLLEGPNGVQMHPHTRTSQHLSSLCPTSIVKWNNNKMKVHVWGFFHILGSYYFVQHHLRG